MFKINNKNLILSFLGAIVVFAMPFMPTKVNASTTYSCEISNFNVSSNYISDGGAITLNWNTNNCNSVNISNVGSVGSSGSMTLYPSSTTTYTLTAHGTSGLSVYASKTVTVLKLRCEISNFNVSSNYISSGGSVTFNWNTNNCHSANITNLGRVNTSGSQVLYPLVTTTYILTAYGTNGESKTQSKTVTVQELVCEISNFDVTPNNITSGGYSILNWSTNNCNSININGIGNVAVSGSQKVYPTQTTTYTLTAYSSNGGSVYATRTIKVIPQIVQSITSKINNNTSTSNVSKTSTTTKSSSSTKTTVNNDNETDWNQTSALAAGALFGANGFMPSSLLGWIIFFILVLLIIILWRKIRETDEDRNKPLKHA